MKRLIVNNFLYYFKSKTKLFISIAFVLSFFVMLNVYDQLEAVEIKYEAYQYRNASQDYHPSLVEDIYLESVDHEEMVELVRKIYHSHGDYAFLLSSGKTNYHLTPQRQDLNQSFIDFYDLVGEENLNLFPSFPDIEKLRFEQGRYDLLMKHLIADDFNAYTLTAANSVSRIFEGFFLLVLMVFSLLLFHDLFSKDFDSKTYRHLYTTPHTRIRIVLSKLLFALLYLLFLLFVSTLLLVIVLLLIRRNEYNVVPTRIGDLRHLKLVNSNILSTFNHQLVYGLASNLSLNILSFLTGMSLLTLWLVLISYLSFKLKSSNNSLIVGIYILISIFAINLTPVKDLFTYVFPLFGFEYRSLDRLQ